MNAYRFTKDGKTWRRVSRKAAERFYENGEYIIISPCNIRPELYGSIEHKAGPAAEYNDRFNNIVAAFSWYNCVNSETGRYPAFYAAE